MLLVYARIKGPSAQRRLQAMQADPTLSAALGGQLDKAIALSLCHKPGKISRRPEQQTAASPLGTRSRSTELGLDPRRLSTGGRPGGIGEMPVIETRFTTASGRGCGMQALRFANAANPTRLVLTTVRQPLPQIKKQREVLMICSPRRSPIVAGFTSDMNFRATMCAVRVQPPGCGLPLRDRGFELRCGLPSCFTRTLARKGNRAFEQ